MLMKIFSSVEIIEAMAEPIDGNLCMSLMFKTFTNEVVRTYRNFMENEMFDFVNYIKNLYSLVGEEFMVKDLKDALVGKFVDIVVDEEDTPQFITNEEQSYCRELYRL